MNDKLTNPEPALEKSESKKIAGSSTDGGSAAKITQCKSDAEESSSEKNNRALNTKISKEVGGPKGLEPTRYGDWEAKGRCYDF